MQNNTLYMQPERLIYLQGRCSELMAGSTLRDLWEVVDQALEYVGGVQITVVVDVDVHHTLGIWGVVEEAEHKMCIIVLKQKEITIMLHWFTWTQTCAYSSEGLDDHPFVLVRACGRLKYVQENLLEKYLHTKFTWQWKTTAWQTQRNKRQQKYK